MAAFFARPASSSAVKITRPPSNDGEDKDGLKQFTPKKENGPRLCRNIMIYGSCKFQDKGCRYDHPDMSGAASSADEAGTVDTPNQSMDTAPPPRLSLEAVKAPVFVPKAAASSSLLSATSAATQSSPSPATPAQTQGAEEAARDDSHALDDPFSAHYTPNPYAQSEQDQLSEDYSSMMEHMQGLTINPYDTGEHHDLMSMSMAVPMDPHYDPAYQSYARQPLDYHLYTAPIPDVFEHNYFLSSSTREELQKRSETLYAPPLHSLNLPDEIQGYHSLAPLEPIPPANNPGTPNPSGDASGRRQWGSWFSSVYRGTKASDGAVYALRRVENYRVMQQAALGPVDAWSRIRNPGIVSVREGFTTRSFNDNSLVVVYDFHPNAQTLAELHLKPHNQGSAPFPGGLSVLNTAGRSANRGRHAVHNGRDRNNKDTQDQQEDKLSERTLWTYIVQIASAIKAVHDAGLAVRMIDPSKILVTGKNRIRISSCGILDVLTYDQQLDMTLLQQEDLQMFGRLIYSLCLGTSNLGNFANVSKVFDGIARQYGQDVKNLLLYLTSKPGPHKNITHCLDMIGGKAVRELDEAQGAVDRLEAELMSELENGRLVRLLCKFGFINERPEFAHEPRWSETGDRYIIKLFRDYVFHQVDEQGRAVVNMGHVLTCLNKLDASSEERILLVSPDEQSCLVVTFKDVKLCMESAFSELAVQ
ncbi:hypothetical protein PUNSTDRAFT_106925 [Punctularia strigosozonata HHB-11173 SS5]|uniref:uncharacterized protein n=1 Tax=Punctularia strigosozonata (strain HHB-11173) TaxID=741275 RepID=UPI0004417FE0|nr:uncharacterized protein PUNSTDRAFT_106925 [Punctularia strigosozonata HHB-11173 SS5]EIN05871.1 hypothetical protein PUNSTDRAFT_106925 [Punctularia strigosozonata HHB-11173 SS5]